MTDQPHDFAADLPRLFAAMDRRVTPLRAAADPAAARRTWLADRAQALLDGGFGPAEVDPVRVDNPTATPAIDHARRFLDQRRLGILVLLGGTGCGKTTAGAFVAREKGGSRPGRIRATALERAGRYDREAALWVQSRTLLVVDDLGVEFKDGKGAFLSLLDELIDVAHANRRRIVLTANLTPAQLADRVEDRIWSRLSQSALIAQCGSTDLRVEGRRAG